MSDELLQLIERFIELKIAQRISPSPGWMFDDEIEEIREKIANFGKP